MQSQQSLILIKNQGFFSADLSYKNGLDDLHHLLARRPINILGGLLLHTGLCWKEPMGVAGLEGAP